MTTLASAAPAAGFPTIGYQELLRRVQHGNPMNRVPLVGSMELTYRCNLACTHCWVNLPTGDRAARARELTYAELQRITDEIVAADGLYMLLTGGEVFVRPDFFDVYRYMKRQGLLMIIFTNGTTVTERVADELAEYPPNRVEISLYGVTPKTYEAMTRVDGLRRCLRGIELLLSRGIKLRLKSVATTTNYDEFLAMRDFVRREFDLPFHYDPNINYRKVEGRSGSEPATVRVPPAKIVELDRQMDGPEENGKIYEGNLRVTSEYLFTCGAGLDTFHVDPYGRLSSCMMVPSITYDLRQGSFKEGWASLFERVVQRKKSASRRCDSCAIAAACDTCPGWSILEHGEGVLEKPVDYLCEINHRRAEAFGPPGLIPTITLKGAPHGRE
ncbi:MAG: radical SAM protein [Candidatus Rokubacteria bacterium]|nr:radical SAM protein [Candidatus Rokubacteria bacterium]